MRLDKYLSHATGLTRSEVKTAVKQKRVKVNDKLVLKSDFFIDPNTDVVYLNGQKVEYKEFIYIMLNKPQGVISATRDTKYKTVIDLIADDYSNYDCFPMGRLDIDTEGLLILTNNGSLLHKVMSPKSEIYKKYYCEVEGEFNNRDINIFLEGFDILDGNDELYHTKKAYLEIIDTNKAYISICEGKFHQIKRMCEATNKKVTYLKRVEMKGITLDENLKPGEYRELTIDELNKLLSIE